MNEPIVATDDLARQLAALAALAKRVKAHADTARALMATRMSPGETKRALHPDDDHVTLGTISMSVGPRRAAVTNEPALAMWVAANHPDQMVSTVDPAYVEALLEASKAAGEPCSPDGELDIPGLTVTSGDPVLKVAVPTLPDYIWRGLLADAAQAVTSGG